ncbi:hypothetical protein BRW65_27110 [Mycobacterium paraffinicum]|uniref:PNPLA domain-containing protein n=2 Tax=Mycobacterium paraffinicum TaxID=53378 RepID=A0A1Q4HFJ9_9MYCO|nr:hypothetical protein BRW65_27110 [Mycobacterium paraffinicum]
MIPVGVATAGWFLHLAWIPNLARYTYGDRSAAVADVRSALGAALAADLLFIGGYALFLGGCAWIFRLRAISGFGRGLSRYVLTAVAVTVAANVIEDCLLVITAHIPQVPKILITATAAAAIVKWCAALLALAGVVAAPAIGFRELAAWSRLARRRRKGRRRDVLGAVSADNWWERALEDPELPDMTWRGQHAAEMSKEEWSWVDAYNVPGANAVIANRKPEPVQAVCLSGGGVRSACVAMGAVQVFSKAKAINPVTGDGTTSGTRKGTLIDTVDYVISVSGGGYTAGARLLATQPTVDAPEKPLLSERFEEGSVEFDHFRRGASYIADSPITLIRALAEVLKNLVASLITLFIVPVIVGSAAGFLLALPAGSIAALVPVPNDKVTDAFKHDNPEVLWSLINHPAAWWALGLFALLTGFFTVCATFAEWAGNGTRSEWWRVRMTLLSQASAVFGLLILMITVGLPVLMRLCTKLGHSVDAGQRGGVTAAAITGVIGLNYLTAIVAMVWKKVKLPGDLARPSWWKSLVPVGVWQILLVVFTLAVLLAVWLITLGSFAAGAFQQMTGGDGIHLGAIPNWQWWLGGLGALALFIGFADVTSLSLHPFYRRRLAQTFAVRRLPLGPMPEAGSDAPQAWQARWYGDEWTWLDRKGRVPAGGPRFVFAAAATLTGRARPAPGLNAVSYVLSADHVGGPDLGWFDTEKLIAECPPRLQRDLTVEAAVAISGAAFASAMGRQNKGFQTLLAASGARLGTWLPNPNFAAKLACAAAKNCADPDDIGRPWPKSLPSIRGASYFYRELFGMNYEDARLVQVTDGGHYENLGLVEALRRRCRLIFCIDGGGDTPPLASGLTDAIRLARYELGVKIRLSEDGPYKVDDIAPGTGKVDERGTFASLKQRVTKGTVVAGTITYPPAAGLPECKGVLIVAKAVLWQRCPYWLLTYAAAQPQFPHDPTSDQWFNEGQFAAYTELGRIIAKQALQCAEDIQEYERKRLSGKTQGDDE